MDFNSKEFRKRYIVEDIKRDKKEIGKSTAWLVLTALITGVGTLGAFLHGENYLSELFSNGAYWDVSLQEMAFGFSSSIAIVGGAFSVHNARNLKQCFKELNSHKEELNMLEIEEEKGKTR